MESIKSNKILVAERAGPVHVSSATAENVLDLTTAKGSQSFRQSIDSLQECKRRLAKTDKLIRLQLFGKKRFRFVPKSIQDRLPAILTCDTRELCAKMISPLIPKKIQEYLPASLIPYCSEKVDVLVLIEEMQRSNITDLQTSMQKSVTVAKIKREELDQLTEDLIQADDENWDAERLQRYLADKSGVALLPEVSELVSREFNILPPKEKDRRKRYLLRRLKSNIAIRKTLMNTLASVCLSELEILHYALPQYYDFVSVARVLAVIRDAAETATDTNITMYIAGQATIDIHKESIRAIGIAVDAARLIDQYAIASPRTQEALERDSNELKKKLLAFRETRSITSEKMSDMSEEALAISGTS